MPPLAFPEVSVLLAGGYDIHQACSCSRARTRGFSCWSSCVRSRAVAGLPALSGISLQAVLWCEAYYKVFTVRVEFVCRPHIGSALKGLAMCQDRCHR